MEFSKQEYWSGLPFPSPEELPNPGMEPGSPALQADSLQPETQWKALGSHSYFLLTAHCVAHPGLLSFPSHLRICRATPSAPNTFNYRTSTACAFSSFRSNISISLSYRYSLTTQKGCQFLYPLISAQFSPSGAQI